MNCRRYRLDQVANFRDLGGYACDGGVTRYGVIFRSTALNKATEEDIAKIEHLGVRTVIDLRFPSETKELPDRLGQDMDYINCSLMGTTKLEQLDIVNSSVVETKTLHRMYRLMLRNGGKEIKKALEVVADSEGAVLFHCAAGKDRTGILAGVAGVLYAHNLSTLTALPKNFGYNMSIMILVFVVLGGIGNIRGSIIAAVLLTMLPELLRGLNDFRMLIYAIVLIATMIITNNEKIMNTIRRFLPKKQAQPVKEETK